MANNRPTNESGVSLIEMAVIAPVLFIIITAIIDFGIKINTIRQVAAAARHSARAAAAYSRSFKLLTNNEALCRVSASVPNGPCGKDAQKEPSLNNDVVTTARIAACNFLKSNGLDPDFWRVSSDVKTVLEDGLQKQIVNVEIERIGKDCLICYEDLSANFQARSSSSFVLEEPCIY